MTRFGAVIICCSLLAAVPAAAQTREKGPWWPHPLWGGEDQAGASNWITPEKVLAAIRLVETGRIYELGQVYERGMPLFGDRTYSMLIPGGPTYNVPFAFTCFRSNASVGMLVIMCLASLLMVVLASTLKDIKKNSRHSTSV